MSRTVWDYMGNEFTMDIPIKDTLPDDKLWLSVHQDASLPKERGDTALIMYSPRGIRLAP